MRIQSAVHLVLLAAIFAGVGALAADQGAVAPPPIKREIIPGSELMTHQERERYRQRMRGAKTAEDRDKVRADHLRRMEERARLRGLRLPATPSQGGPK